MDAARRPRPKSTALLLCGGGELHIVGHDDVTTIPDADGMIHRIFRLADGSRSTRELHGALVLEYPDVDADEVVETVGELADLGLLEYSAVPARRFAAAAHVG